MVGVSKPSGPSEAFLCEKWMMAEPGESLTSTFTLLHLKDISKRFINETVQAQSNSRSLIYVQQVLSKFAISI